MFQRSVLRAVILFAVANSNVWAQNSSALEDNGIHLGDPVFEATLAEKHVRSPNLPDHIAFRTLLGTLDGINERKPALALSLVQNNMGMDQISASEFLDQAISTRQALNAESDLAIRDRMCAQGIPRVSGHDVYEAFDDADRIKDQLSLQKLTVFQQRLNDAELIRLSEWLADIKVKSVHLKFDHEKRYKQIQIDPDAQIALMCGRT